MSKRRIAVGLLAALMLTGGLAGCGKSNEGAAVTGDPKSLEGTGTYQGMPPEARKAMEEARAKGGQAQGQPPAQPTQ